MPVWLALGGSYDRIIGFWPWRGYTPISGTVSVSAIIYLDRDVSISKRFIISKQTYQLYIDSFSTDTENRVALLGTLFVVWLRNLRSARAPPPVLSSIAPLGSYMGL